MTTDTLLRDLFAGPFSTACAGIAGIAAIATGAISIWIAMPIGLLLGWVIGDRIAARR